MFFMTYIKIFFKVQTSSTAHYILPWKVAAIVEENPAVDMPQQQQQHEGW